MRVPGGFFTFVLLLFTHSACAPSVTTQGRAPSETNVKDERIIPLADLHRDTALLRGRVKWERIPIKQGRAQKGDTMAYGISFDTLTNVSALDLKKHLFGRLAPPGEASGMFYQQGTFVPTLDPLRLSDSADVVSLSTSEFMQLIRSVRSMEAGGFHVPSPEALSSRGTYLYKLLGAVPVAVLDITFSTLTELDGQAVGLSETGRLTPLRPLKYASHRLLAVAPLIPYVPARQFRVMITPDIVVSNVTKSSGYRFVSSDTTFLLGTEPVQVRTRKAHLVFGVQREGDARRARSYFTIVPVGRRAANNTLGVFRGSESERSTSYHYALAASGSLMRTNDSIFVPGASPAPARLTTNTAWRGMEIGVWFSDVNAARPTEQRVIEPFFILGGQDEDTNDPQALYNTFADRLGTDAMARIHSRFDVFVLSYFAGGTSGECTDPGGGTPECRRLGIKRSLLDNAVLTADAMYFVYDHYSIQAKAVFVGISMGGVVSRLAFLGIEHGPDTNDPSMYRSFNGFPARTVPVRRWITVDSPHQGASIPLGMQDWVSKLSWLPPVAVTEQLLDSPSSKELLLQHHSVTPPTLTSERNALLAKLGGWGGFPKTIEGSIAIASGSASLPLLRPSLWKLESGKIPVYEGCPRGCFRIADFIMNSSDAAVSEVQSSTAPYMRSYLPLGPNAIPIQALSATWTGSTSAASVTLDFEALTTEATYSASSFEQYPQTNPPTTRIGTGSYGRPNEHWPGLFNRWWMVASLSGWLKVNVPILGTETIDFFMPASASVPLTPNLKPLAIQAGGYRETTRSMSAQLQGLFGTPLTTDYLPRHSFIPTNSAIDLDPGFLAAAYKAAFVDPGYEINTFYSRGLKRGVFNPDDYVDWLPFYRILESRWALYSSDPGSAIVFITANPGSVTLPDGSKWTGRPTPFTLSVVQALSLQHTYFDTGTRDLILDVVFYDGDLAMAFNQPATMPHIYPLKELRDWYFFETLPPILPPQLTLPPNPPGPPPPGWMTEPIPFHP